MEIAYQFIQSYISDSAMLWIWQNILELLKEFFLDTLLCYFHFFFYEQMQ